MSLAQNVLAPAASAQVLCAASAFLASMKVSKK